MSRYVHLNPVRVRRLGVDQRRRAAGRWGLAPAPSRQVVEERLRVGGVDYTTAGAAVSRMARRLAWDRRLRQQVERLERQLPNVEM